jgi:outer membrane protein TolC
MTQPPAVKAPAQATPQGKPQDKAASAAPARTPVDSAQRDAMLRDPKAPIRGTLTLDPKLLVQLLVARSAEIEYSHLQIEVAQNMRRAEDALYEPVLFQSTRRESRERQRTVEERLASLATSRVNTLQEDVNSVELGVRSRFSTGAEASVSYRQTEKQNNIIASGGTYDTEYNGSLILSIKQPLWRGRGRSVVETDRKLAEAEEKISLLQYRQQLLKTCSDALTLYWQLYRALEVYRIRQLAVDNTKQILADTKARIDAGRVPASNMLEANAAALLREVELNRAEQGVREAEARIQTLLSISSLQDPGLRLLAREDSTAMKMSPVSVQQRYQLALDTWPAYQIARLRNEQANLRLNFADNQRKPAVDLVMSRSNTGLASDRTEMRQLASTARYPEWYVGINVEMPLGGNQKAESQYRAQTTRVKQSQLEIDSVYNALANDIRIRQEQAEGALLEVQQVRRDVELREQIFNNERIRYDSGLGLLTLLLQREGELNEARQRLVESNTRLGQANVALMFSDGSLLQEYGITLKD